RVMLREVHLYVKSGGGDWVRQEAVPPNTPHFTYRVPQDGEYLFALVTVDKQGKVNPPDINAVAPALRVVVDTRQPVIDSAFVVENKQTALAGNLPDTNPDMQSVRAVVMAEQGDRALTPLPGQGVGFYISPTDMNLPIRIQAADLCGNIATKDLSGRDATASL